jgi:hypothetical protein
VNATASPQARRRLAASVAGTVLAAPIALAPTSPASAAPRAVWSDHHRTSFGSGAVRSPDGSIVTTAWNGTNDGDVVQRARLVDGQLQWTSATLPVKMRPGNIVDEVVATGETVYVRVIDVNDDEFLLRAKVPGEVAGPTKVLRGKDVDAIEDSVRVDATHIGTVGSRGGDGETRQLVVVSTRGLRWIGPKNAPGFAEFYPSALTASGALVSVTSELAWRYPALPEPVAYRTAETDVDPSPTPDPATGTGEDVVTTRKPLGPLETPTSDRQGDTVTQGFADAQLAIYSPLRAARIAAVPIPPEYDASCRAASPVVDSRSIELGAPWRGPGGDIWALAGCASTSSYGDDPNPRHSWLVTWKAGTLESAFVRLPSRGHGLRPRIGQGLMMRDGKMYIPTDVGTIRVSGLARSQRPVARIRAVTRRPGGRVRVQIACIGAVGSLCSGQVRIRDRAGTIATLPYAVGSGSVGMQPFVTREVALHRAASGKPTAALSS